MRLKNPRPLSVRIGVLAAVAFPLAACGSSSPGSTDTGATAASTSAGSTAELVTIDNFAFAPSSLTIKVGATVTWTNDQGAAHTVTADDDSWKSENLAQGATFSHTFDAAGTFSYHCEIHRSMKAAIIAE